MKYIYSVAPIELIIYLFSALVAYVFYPVGVMLGAEFVDAVVAFYKSPKYISIFNFSIAIPIVYAMVWWGMYIFNKLFFYIIAPYVESKLWLKVRHFKVFKDILEKYYNFNLADLEKDELYNALSRFNQYWLNTTRTIHQATFRLIGSIVSVIASFLLIILNSGRTMAWEYLVVVSLLPILGRIVIFIQDSLYRKFVKKETWMFRMQEYLLATLLDVRTFLEKKVNGIYKYLTKRFVETDSQIGKDKIDMWGRRQLVVGIVETFEYYLHVLVLWWFIAYAISIRMAVGAITGTVNIMNNIYNKVRNAITNYVDIVSSVRYTRDLYDILTYEGFASQKLQSNTDVKRQVKSDVILRKISEVPLPPDIEFRRLSFRFPGRQNYILKDVNWKVKGGEKVFIYGSDGSGKTALLKILTTLFPVPPDSYLIDGTPVEQFARGQVKELFSIVPEYFERFFLPLKENVIFGDISKPFSKRHYEYALRVADIYDWAKQHRLVYSKRPLGTYFSEGLELPSGYWQKVAIARAIYRDRPIFVFDMSFSYIDEKAQKRIMENVVKHVTVRRKTFIFISESLQFADYFDTHYEKTVAGLKPLK